MTTYHEVLPPAKSGKPRGFRWTPTGPGRGRMVIEDAKTTSAYAVAEIPAGEDGRGFRFLCLGGQTDREAPESYDVFACRHGQNHTCECRGFLRWGKPCKHILAALDLITNGWLDSPVNPEADVASTEVHDQVEPPF